MLDKIFNITEACIVLKDGYILKDSYNTIFRMKKEKILIRGENVSCFLSLLEFKELYKDSKFVVFDDNDSIIDSKKDDEYYSFKHK
jgi:hypothetical protein